MVWVTPDDVMSLWFGGDRPTDPETLIPLISMAEAIIRTVFRDMQARLDATDEEGEPVEPDLPELIRLVVSRMVIRSIRNPEGVRAIQKGAGPFQETVTLAGEDPGSLFMISNERDLLLPPGANGRTGKAFTIDPAEHAQQTGGPRHLDICSVWFGGDCSCGAFLVGLSGEGYWR